MIPQSCAEGEGESYPGLDVVLCHGENLPTGNGVARSPDTESLGMQHPPCQSSLSTWQGFDPLPASPFPL